MVLAIEFTVIFVYPCNILFEIFFYLIDYLFIYWLFIYLLGDLFKFCYFILFYLFIYLFIFILHKKRFIPFW